MRTSTINGINTPQGTIQVARQDGNFELTVTFANRQRKTAMVTTEHFKKLTHEGATVQIKDVITMRRDAWRFNRRSGPAPRCVYMYFAGTGSDLIVVTLQDLIRATGVRP